MDRSKALFNLQIDNLASFGINTAVPWAFNQYFPRQPWDDFRCPRPGCPL